MTRRAGANRDEPRAPVLDPATLGEEPVSLAGDFEHERVRIAGEHTGLDGEGTLSECEVVGADLTGTTLRPLTMRDVRWRRTELSNAVLRNVIAARVEIAECRAVGLRLDLRQASDLLVRGCRLDYANVRLRDGKGRIRFEGCTFREATICGELNDVVFTGCDLTAAEFDAESARDCDLRGSTLDCVRGLLTLRGAMIGAEQALEVAEALAIEAGLRVIHPA
ncbi:MAG TPA: pentapeptide repeat-containing protein [Pseudonocardiaceae bacterium]